MSRLGQGPATGIDRVEAEWLAHMQTRPHLLLCRTGAGQLLLPPAAGAAILDWIAGRGLEALPAPGLMDRLRGRRDLRARAGAALRGRFPAGRRLRACAARRCGALRRLDVIGRCQSHVLSGKGADECSSAPIGRGRTP